MVFLLFNCFKCEKRYKIKFNKKLIDKFENPFKFGV